MTDSPRFEFALLYAARRHRGQRRRGTDIPYMSHLLAVTALVAEFGGDEDQAIAALLHDAPEDQGGRATLEEIGTLFGPRVARIVDGCTDTYDDPKPPWRPRKEAYLSRLVEVEPDTLLVAAADKLHNARCLVTDLRREGLAAFEKFNGKIDGTLWYYREVLRAGRGRLREDLADELRRTVHELHWLAGKEHEA